MAWDKTKPIGTTKVKDSPSIFTGNWTALEDWTSKEHYSLAAGMSGMHKPGYAGVVYYGPLSALSALYSAPPCGSFAIVTESTSGALALAINVTSAGSGTWNNVTPSHLMLADLTCGDPHTQYLKLAGGTMVGSLMASGDPQSATEVATKSFVEALASSAYDTRTFCWVISNPSVASIPGPRLKVAETATRIDSYCVGSSGVSFNIECRQTIGVSGVNLLASDQMAVTSGSTTTSLAACALSADSWLMLDVSALSGAPTMLVVTLAVTVP